MNFIYSIKSFVVIGLVLLASVTAGAQSSEDFRQQENQRLQAIEKGFEVFLNEQASDKDRIAAVADYPMAKDPKQIAALKTVVGNREASPAIRTKALSSIHYYLQEDEKFYNDVISLLSNNRTPKPLREECLRAVGVLSFSAFGMQVVSEDLLKVYRDLLNDEDILFRRDAYNKLAIGGDDIAQQNLIEGLKNADVRPLPADECIRLLGYDIKGDYYPVIHEVAQNTTELKTKVAAIKVLGNYAPAKSDIITYLNDTNESDEVRLAAIKSLNAFDKENFTTYAESLLQKADAPAEVLIYAINAEKYRRLSPTFKVKEGDTFDQSVKSLLEQKDLENVSTDLVRQSAQNYITTLGLGN